MFVDAARTNGARARGRVGDADPLQAIADALPIFPADRDRDRGQAGALGRRADDLVSRARSRFALPIVRAEESLPRLRNARSNPVTAVGIDAGATVSLAHERSNHAKGSHEEVHSIHELRAVRPARPALSAVAVAAAVAAAAGIAASPAHDAKPREAKFKHPQLEHGVLAIEGTNKSDKVALRLRAATRRFCRSTSVTTDRPNSASKPENRDDRRQRGTGDDLVRIDESNGVFTDPSRQRSTEETETTTGRRSRERRTLLGGDGNDSIDGSSGSDMALLGAGDDTFVWDPGDGSDIVEGQDGTDTMLFNGANVEREDRPVGEREPAAAVPRRRQRSRWTPPAWSRSTSTPSAAPTRSRSTT